MIRIDEEPQMLFAIDEHWQMDYIRRKIHI